MDKNRSFWVYLIQDNVLVTDIRTANIITFFFCFYYKEEIKEKLFKNIQVFCNK